MLYFNITKRILKIDPKEKTKMIGKISQKQMGVYLKDRKNTFFRRVESILSKNAEDFVKSFIERFFSSIPNSISVLKTSLLISKYQYFLPYQTNFFY